MFFLLAGPIWLNGGNVQAAPAQEEEAEVSSDGVAEVWDSRNQELLLLEEELNSLEINAQNLLPPLARKLEETRMRISRLMGLYQAAHGYLSSQFLLYLQIRVLYTSLQADAEPMEVIAATIGQRQEEIKQLRNNMLGLDEMAAAAQLPEMQGPELALQRQYQQRLQEISQHLDDAARKVAGIMEPMRGTLSRLQASLDGISKSMLSLWHDYYFSPAAMNLDIFTSTQLPSWLGAMSARLNMALPKGTARWFEVGKRLIIILVVMGLISVAAYRGCRRLPGRWAASCQHIISGAWVWVTVGMAVLTASNSSLGFMYYGLLLPGVLILIWGISRFSWDLRCTAAPYLEAHPSPLRRLYFPAALGVILLYSDISPRILSGLWILLMLAFSAQGIMAQRKQKFQESSLLENVSHKVSILFALASLFMSLGGYARLAVLLFMFLFALVNIMTLASALSTMGAMCSDRLFDKHTKPIINALSRAVAIPLSWLLSLLCTLPWLWAVPGARYVAEYVMSTRYELGQASMDISRLLLIVVMFFFCRSFIRLGKTSLAQLPSRLPHMEKGVIPPLQHMLGYILWALLGVIVLSIIGVDLTSLAVVAGGLSVGIGFGLQNLFSNLISGLMLIFGRSVLIGDYVSVGGVEGTVKALKIRSLLIETTDRALVFVPNSAIMTAQFTNWTRNNRMVRKAVKVGVAYGTDTEMVSRLLLDIAAQQEHVLKEPAPFVLFDNFGDSSLDFTLYVYVDDFSVGAVTASRLRHRINQRFEENNISIPFPQLDVHTSERFGAAEN